MNDYLKYLTKRVLAFLVVTFGALVINFTIPRLVPGDPLASVLQQISDVSGYIGSEELVEEYKRMFGLDKDILTQFFAYLQQILRGNLGYSISNFPAKVDVMIMRAFPYTIRLLGISVITSWVIGSILGVIGGWKEGSKFSEIMGAFSFALYTIPYYILALILIFIFAYTIPLFPISGAYSVWIIPDMSLSFILSSLYHMFLPALSIVLSNVGWWFLSMKSMIIGLKGEDFILLAEAKGLGERRIMWKYAFRNALLPQATGLALSLGGIVSGAMLTEVIFQYPGIGTLLYAAILNNDYPLIQGITLIITISVCTATLLIDLIYPLIDPRIKYTKS